VWLFKIERRGMEHYTTYDSHQYKRAYYHLALNYQGRKKLKGCPDAATIPKSSPYCLIKKVPGAQALQPWPLKRSAENPTTKEP
jgi:hypothetical protein